MRGRGVIYGAMTEKQREYEKRGMEKGNGVWSGLAMCGIPFVNWGAGVEDLWCEKWRGSMEEGKFRQSQFR